MDTLKRMRTMRVTCYSHRLTHLTAVSGANVTIVCGAVLLTAALVGPRVAATAAIIALIAFVAVVQPSASVLRAAVMGGIALFAILSRR